MNTDYFVHGIQTKDFYNDIAEDVEESFGSSKYSKNDNRSLLTRSLAW